MGIISNVWFIYSLCVCIHGYSVLNVYTLYETCLTPPINKTLHRLSLFTRKEIYANSPLLVQCIKDSFRKYSQNTCKIKI